MTKQDKKKDEPVRRMLFPTLAEISKGMKYCPKCNEYPLKVDAPCPCNESKKKKTDKEIQIEITDKLGGRRYYDLFRTERYRVNDRNRSVFDYVQGFDPAKDNLYLWGPQGRGKTHLAVILARRIISGGQDARVRKPSVIMRRLQRASLTDPQTLQRYINQYVRLDVLVIDDLGTEKSTLFSVEKLFEIVDGRYAAGRGGLVITSNLDLNELAEKLDDRKKVSSRLCEMCHIANLNSEPDYRRKNV